MRLIKGSAFPIRLAILCLATAGLLSIRAAEGPGENALVQLSQVLYAHPAPADDPGPTVFRSLYWLRMATTLNDLSPTAALRIACQRVNDARTPGAPQLQSGRGSNPAPYEAQLLADWHVACLYGLFTPENLARLQAGLAPVATDGSFTGRTIEAKKIRPGSRHTGIGDVALGPQDGALAADAQAQAQRQAMPAAPYVEPAEASTPPQRATPPAPESLRVVTKAPLYRMPPGTHDMPMPVSDRPSAPVAVPVDPAAKDPPHILLQDVPLNGLLPTDGKVKIGIAQVTASEISASIVGERQVLIKTYQGTFDHYVPSIHNFKVPKTNPVRLPGISNDAYLLRDDNSGPHGAEVRYYYIDVVVNSGSSFRIAKVTGGL